MAAVEPKTVEEWRRLLPNAITLAEQIGDKPFYMLKGVLHIAEIAYLGNSHVPDVPSTQNTLTLLTLAVSNAYEPLGRNYELKLKTSSTHQDAQALAKLVKLVASQEWEVFVGIRRVVVYSPIKRVYYLNIQSPDGLDSHNKEAVFSGGGLEILVGNGDVAHPMNFARLVAPIIGGLSK